jgi:hypothetical protein
MLRVSRGKASACRYRAKFVEQESILDLQREKSSEEPQMISHLGFFFFLVIPLERFVRE